LKVRGDEQSVFHARGPATFMTTIPQRLRQTDGRTENICVAIPRSALRVSRGKHLILLLFTLPHGPWEVFVWHVFASSTWSPQRSNRLWFHKPKHAVVASNPT